MRLRNIEGDTAVILLVVSMNGVVEEEGKCNIRFHYKVLMVLVCFLRRCSNSRCIYDLALGVTTF